MGVAGRALGTQKIGHGRGWGQKNRFFQKVWDGLGMLPGAGNGSDRVFWVFLTIFGKSIFLRVRKHLNPLISSGWCSSRPFLADLAGGPTQGKDL